MTAIGPGVSFGGDENSLGMMELDRGDGCTTLQIY